MDQWEEQPPTRQRRVQHGRRLSWAAVVLAALMTPWLLIRALEGGDDAWMSWVLFGSFLVQLIVHGRLLIQTRRSSSVPGNETST